MSDKKTIRQNLVFSKQTRVLLEKLTRIHDRSMTGVIEQLIKKEAKEYGLIEARE
jgi:hypothetical protein